MTECAEGEARKAAAGDRPVRGAGVASAGLEGEVVLLDATGHVHLLNPTAGLLWACFDGRATVEEIAAEAAEAFAVHYEAMLADVRAFADELAALALVTVRPNGAAGSSPS